MAASDERSSKGGQPCNAQAAAWQLSAIAAPASPGAAVGCRVAPPPQAARRAFASGRLVPGSCAAPRRRRGPGRGAPSARQAGGGRAMRGLQHSPFTPFRCTIRAGAGCRQARAAVRKPPAHQRRRAAPVHGGGDVALRAALGRRLALVHLGGKAQRAQALLQAGARRSDAEKQRGHSTRAPCPASAHAPPQHLRMLLPSTGACCCGVGERSRATLPLLHRRTCTDSGSGLTLTNMRVLPEPPRQGCSRWVRRELRYGTCALRLASAWNTSPSEDRLLLMLHASLARCPSAWLRASRSLQGHAAGD